MMSLKKGDRKQPTRGVQSTPDILNEKNISLTMIRPTLNDISLTYMKPLKSRKKPYISDCHYSLAPFGLTALIRSQVKRSQRKRNKKWVDGYLQSGHLWDDLVSVCMDYSLF
jgi:hypothetical protein